MKMRIIIIAMSVVLSAPVVAMHRRALPAPASYKIPAIVGGAVLAGYAGFWTYDWLATGNIYWDIKNKIDDESKVYNARLEKYRVNRPIESTRNSPTYTNHGAWNQDQYDYYSFIEAVYKDLKAEYNKGTFDSDQKHEADEKELKERDAQQESVRITNVRVSDEELQTFIFRRIQEEKIELEGYLDTLAQACRCFSGWYNVRKTYKQICGQQRVRYGHEKDWSHVIHDKVDNVMHSTARTGLFHLLVGKPMYGRVARLYWDVLQRYARLEKIEVSLMEKLDRKIIVSEQEKERRKARKKKHAQQDQLFTDWLWYRTIEPVKKFFSAA